MDVMAERTMIPYHLTVLRLLPGTVLALPGELRSGDKVIRISVLVHHSLLLQRYQEEDMRRLWHEAGIPGRLIEGHAEGPRNGFA